MKQILTTIAISCCAIAMQSTFAAPATISKADWEHGQKIYQGACHTCHNDQMAPMMKSPKAHVDADYKAADGTNVLGWTSRSAVAQKAIKSDAKYKGMTVVDYFVQQVKHGYKAMPAGGACTSCTDADYQAAVKFMMSPLTKAPAK